MTDRRERLERDITTALDAAAPGGLPMELLERIERQVDSGRRRPRWLALLREPSMRLGSTLAVGSPALRIVALLVATILLVAGLAVGGVVGARLLDDGTAIIVDRSGDGTVTTIEEALAMADQGDLILVRPGTYVEAITIDKDITMRGTGTVGDVVIRAPEGGPTTDLATDPDDPFASHRRDPYAIHVTGAAPVLSDLVLQGERSAIHVDGGQPVLQDLIFDGVGRPQTHLHGLDASPDAIVVAGGAIATVRRNVLRDGGPITIYDPASALVSDNTLAGGPSILSLTNTPGTVIRSNSISGALGWAIGVLSRDGAGVVIEGNRVDGPAADGISVGFGHAAGTDPIVEGNVISGARIGIAVAPGAAPHVEANVVTGNGTGLSAERSAGQMVVVDNEFIDNGVGLALDGSAGRLEDNDVSGGSAGIVLVNGGSPHLIGNVIEGATERGLSIERTVRPVVEGNRICGNGTDLTAEEHEGIPGTNHVCAESPQQKPAPLDG